MLDYEDIDKARKELNLPSEDYTDEQVRNAIKNIKFLARSYIELMTDGLDDEIRPKVRKKLLKMGYSDEDISKYERIRTKKEYGFPLDFSGEDHSRMMRSIRDYQDVYIEIQNRVMKAKLKD